MSIRIHLCAALNLQGMPADVTVFLKSARLAGLRATASAAGFATLRNKVRREALHWIGFQPYDINVHVERVFTRFLGYARYNVLVPNQEWCRPETLDHLGSIDSVWCKTRHAQEIFGRLHPGARYIGWTSEDCRVTSVKMERGTFLHVGYRKRGTGAVIEAWRRHPEWPPVTLLTRAERPDAENLSNVHHVREHLPRKEFLRLLNASEIQLRLTEMEGWGHSLVEAMSCGRLVLTTNGAPMNEIVTPERGVLVAPSGSEPHHLGTCYDIDVDDLCAKVEHVLGMSQAERDAFGRAARAWYEENDRAFPGRLRAAVEDLVGHPGQRERM